MFLTSAGNSFKSFLDDPTQSKALIFGTSPTARLIDVNVTLPAGKYKLRYKSDGSHSFDNWNAFPPAINHWGIALYDK